MGQLYNKGGKPTIYCRGNEIYPSTSVGEVIYAGNTLVWHEGPPTSLYDVVWPAWDATEDDTNASFPVHLDYLMCVGFLAPPAQGLAITNEEDIQPKASRTNGLYISNESSHMTGLMLTTFRQQGNLPNSMGMWDLKNEVQVNDLSTLEDGFYPVSLWEDYNYDGLFEYKGTDYMEFYYGQKILSMGGPSIKLSDDSDYLPCSWILKMGSRFLSYAYSSNECLYLGGYHDLKTTHGVSTMEEAREKEFQLMLAQNKQ